MEEDNLDLTDRERHAIEAIGRELDREFGGAGADAARDGGAGSVASAVSPKRSVAALYVALGVVMGTLSAVAVIALTTFIVPRGSAPVAYAPPSGNVEPSGARADGLPGGPGPMATSGRSDREPAASNNLRAGDAAISSPRREVNRSVGHHQPRRVSRRPIDRHGSQDFAIVSATVRTPPLVQAP